jgi:hypothetical protein
MASIVHAIVESVDLNTNADNTYLVKLRSINGQQVAINSDDLFAVGDFVSYRIENGYCLDFAPFSNDHKVRLSSAYQNARIQHQRAQDAKQAYQVFSEETVCLNGSADQKNAVNSATTAVTSMLGLPTLAAGIFTANPFMMMAGAGMLGGTASAVKDTTDNDAEKRLRRIKLGRLRSQVEDAAELSKQADSVLETLFNRYRQEALEAQAIAA